MTDYAQARAAQAYFDPPDPPAHDHEATAHEWADCPACDAPGCIESCVCPTCDHCGEAQELGGAIGDPDDWNGETGCHRTCEAIEHLTNPIDTQEERQP